MLDEEYDDVIKLDVLEIHGSHRMQRVTFAQKVFVLICTISKDRSKYSKVNLPSSGEERRLNKQCTSVLMLFPS